MTKPMTHEHTQDIDVFIVTQALEDFVMLAKMHHQDRLRSIRLSRKFNDSHSMDAAHSRWLRDSYMTAAKTLAFRAGRRDHIFKRTNKATKGTK